MKPINVFWFRRDLRLHDNSGLFHALNASFEVLPIFIFDTNILDQLGDKTDARLTFIHGTIQSLKNSLQNWQSDMMVMHGDPLTIWKEIINIYNVNAVYANHDYEPYGLQRDQSVMHFLQSKGIHFYSYKDIVFFEKSEVVKDNNEPYSVFTPYKKTWLSKFEIIKANNPDLLHFPSEKCLDKLLKVNVPYRNFYSERSWISCF
ncbi:MAG: deoxyribodipyrimidine photo-lyase [Saprospiraceae bacterium]